MHTSLPASSLHTPCVWELTSYHSRTQCFFRSLWTRTDAALIHHCRPFSIFLHLFPLTSLFLLSIPFSLTLFQSFFLSGSKDVRHSSVWFVLPSPSASLLLPPFLLSSFTEKEGGRRRVEEGGCEGDVLSASVLFCVCGVAKISTEYKKKWKDMWGSLC